jgi:hypothetical protein
MILDLVANNQGAHQELVGQMFNVFIVKRSRYPLCQSCGDVPFLVET